jgi:hypothetical protein
MFKINFNITCYYNIIFIIINKNDLFLLLLYVYVIRNFFKKSDNKRLKY